ncbi:helix-hairpin-helix domain-containing protein [Candidatus Korobacter versatilis]|nr:helix-hairpin-helix domain-containing protein [Candidatus Koribacter versatilis]
MKRLLFWTAGIVLGVWVARELRQAGMRLSHVVRRVDLNLCSHEDLVTLPGITEHFAERIVENRPYRHRLDLVARMVIPSGVYQEIRDLIDVESGSAVRTANVAS